MKTALIRSAAIATVIVASVALFASPSYADARSIPAGDTMYALSCDENLPPDQLLSVDPVTGDSSPIGDGTATGNDCADGAAWDAQSNTAYYLDGYGTGSIYSVNLATGVGAFAFLPTLDGSPEPIDSFAITPAGLAYAVNYSGDTLYSMSLANGELTEIGPLVNGDAQSFLLAADPRTGALYGFSYLNDSLDRVDVNTGLATPIASNVADPSGNSALAMQVDSTGNIWILEGSGDPETLLSIDPDANDIAASATESGGLSTNGVDTFPQALIDVPAPATTVAPTKPAGPTLATTGVNAGPAGALGGGMLILGILALAARMLLRRQRARA